MGKYFTWILANISSEYWEIFHLNIEEYCISPEYGGIFHLNMGEFFTWILGNISLSLRQWSTPLGRGGHSSIVKETVWNIYHIGTLQKYNLTKSKYFKNWNFALVTYTNYFIKIYHVNKQNFLSKQKCEFSFKTLFVRFSLT